MSKSKNDITQKDMHPADIKALFEKRNVSLAQLSRHHGLQSNTLSVALHRPYPKGERIIADFLGMDPEHMWPERYAHRNTKNNGFIGTSSHVA
jgi:Ner family transcriptional regulator